MHLVFFFVDLVFSVAYHKDKKKHLGFLALWLALDRKGYKKKGILAQ